MDSTAVSEEEDGKAKTVSEIIDCSLELAKELLAGCDGDVNEVIDTFLGSEVSGTQVDQDVEVTPEKTAGDVSPVLKRKRPLRSATDSKEKIDRDPPGKKFKFKFKKVKEAPSNHLAENTVGIEVYKKINVLPTRNFDTDSELEREFRIAEGHFLRMVQGRGSYEIQSIDIVHNEKLKKRFDKKKQELKSRGLDEKPLLIFHGTPQENIEHILRENFDLSKVANGRKYGNGVYFSEVPEVSMKYSKDEASLILCLVLQGDNSKEVKIPQTGIQDYGAYKNYGAFAIVVPDVDQILPKYVIHFADKPKDTEKSQPALITPGSLNWPTSASGSANASNPASHFTHLAAGFSGPPITTFSAPLGPTHGFSVPQVPAPGFSSPYVPFPGFSTPQVSATGFSTPVFSVPAPGPFPSQAANSQSSVAAQTSQPAPAGQAGYPPYTWPFLHMPSYNQMSQTFSGMQQIVPQTMPGMQQAIPGMQQTMPGMQQAIPGMQQAMPGMQQIVPQTMPGMQQTLPGMQQAMPGMQQTVPLIMPWMQQTMPMMQQTISGMQQTIPGMPQTVQGMPQTIPGMPQTVPGMPQTVPGIPQTMPGMPQTVPGVQQTMPGMQQHQAQVRVSVPTLQALKPGQRIPAGHPGHFLTKTQTGKVQIVRVALGQGGNTITPVTVPKSLPDQPSPSPAQASSSANSAAVPPFLPKSTKGKVGRPSKVRKNEEVDSKGNASGSDKLNNSKKLLKRHKKEKSQK